MLGEVFSEWTVKYERKERKWKKEADYNHPLHITRFVRGAVGRPVVDGFATLGPSRLSGVHMHRNYTPEGHLLAEMVTLGACM